jgi:hypothetical protein
VFCPVLELREEKRTFAKVEGGNMDFFQPVAMGYYQLSHLTQWAVAHANIGSDLPVTTESTIMVAMAKHMATRPT